MSYLLLETVENAPLAQNFEVTDRLQLVAIRPWLYLHNDPVGSIKVSLKFGAETIASKTLTVAEILTLANLPAGRYHHGFFTFDLEAVLNIKTTYQITVEGADGYAYDPDKYFAWIKPHENLVNTFNENVLFDDQNPFGYQIWGYKK
jgi:hypothetical protein